MDGTEMIARIKVLGMRAANVGTLRVAARGIVSYLQGGDNNTPAAAEKGALGAGGTVAAGHDRGGPKVAVGSYMAGGSGHSQGRARGRGAAAMGLAGPVSAGELEAVLIGRHARSGEVLLGATGASGRRTRMPAEARAVARHGDPGEWLTLAEAAFLIGLEPRYLRRLAEHQPQTALAAPSGADRADARLARRLIEASSGGRSTPPGEAYLLADKDPDSGDWRVSRGEVERFIAERVAPETVMGYDLGVLGTEERFAAVGGRRRPDPLRHRRGVRRRG